MSALASLKAGDLAKSLVALQNDVRNNPADPKLRVFLFQLYSLIGEHEKALNQLNVLRDLSRESLMLVQTYQEALVCESFRNQVFEGKRSPLVFGEPEEWVALMINALHQSDSASAKLLRDKALEMAPAISGSLTLYPNSLAPDSSEKSQVHRFEWIADADSRLGPIFEAIIHGKYYWIPANRVQSVTFERVTDLRDLVWLPAKFQWKNGGETVALVPTSYANTCQSKSDAVRMAKTTEWTEVDEFTYHGMGVRVWSTDENEFPMTTMAMIAFDPNPSN